MDLPSNISMQWDSAATLQHAIACGPEEGKRRASTRVNHRCAKPTKRCSRRVVSDSPYYHPDASEGNRVGVFVFHAPCEPVELAAFVNPKDKNHFLARPVRLIQDQLIMLLCRPNPSLHAQVQVKLSRILINTSSTGVDIGLPVSTI